MKMFRKKALVTCLVTALILSVMPVSLNSYAKTDQEEDEEGVPEVMEHLQESAEQDGTVTYDEESVIRIQTNEDWRTLAENCTLDTWSQDKVVVLEADLDFSSEGITCIPTFGGIFLGQNHTVKGFVIEGTSDYTGLFRYIQESGQIWNLNVEMDATTDESHSGIGLLAGRNSGLISCCSAKGTLNVNNDAGVLVGFNEVSGIIEDSTSDGTVIGKHRIGGLVGTNKGGITECKNYAYVNNTPQDNRVDIQSLSLEEILGTENAASVTDIGGITGTNEGVILNSVNNGSIGYQHVGYNIGGIAGSQTGYIMGCENHGPLNGRKDVGGIAGQMEPSSEMEYEEDTLEKLSKEFPVLHDLVTKLDNDASGMSTSLSTQINVLLDAVEGAQNAVDNILNDLSNDYENVSDSFSITGVGTPKPVSLDFLDNIPSISPIVSPTPSESPSESPDQSATPDSSGSGTGTGTDGSDSNNEDNTTNSSKNDLENNNTITKIPELIPTESTGSITKDEITYQVPYRLSSNAVADTNDDTIDSETKDQIDFDSITLPSISPSYDVRDKIDREKLEKEINDAQSNAYDSVNKVISDAESKVRDQADRTKARVESAKTSLSSSFTKIIDQTRTLNNMSDDYNQLLLDDMQAINDEVQVITNIITNTDAPEADEIYTDVSDDDKAEDTEGKLMSCTNYGKICGDLNVGGIAGTMSRENNLDPEDDLNLTSDSTSLNVKFKERIVIRECTNNGKVEGQKECAGGVVGNMTLGSVISAMNTGTVSGEAEKVGGIAGESMGTIRQSSSKCALSGDNQIGGIVGNGTTITDCYSMVEIRDGEFYLGSIAGKLEDDSGTVENNYFVEGCTPGIDGISYEGQAQPVSYDEFLELPDVPDEFRSINLTFMADDKQISKITIQYGEDFDDSKLPKVPDKDGYTGVWEEFNTENITFDQTIEAVYTEYITSLEACLEGEKLPKILVEGMFDTGDAIEIDYSDLYPDNLETNAESYQVKLTTEDSGVHLYRFRPDEILEMENPTIEIYEDGEFVPVETSQDGSYLTFEYEEDEFTFVCIDRPQEGLPIIWIAIAGVACLLIVVLLIVIIRKKHKKNEEK